MRRRVYSSRNSRNAECALMTVTECALMTVAGNVTYLSNIFQGYYMIILNSLFFVLKTNPEC